MINPAFLTRQSDLIPSERLNQQITVIGAGAIGSFTVLALSKMGFNNIKVYDFDEVSVENMNCQWYRVRDIGELKVIALKKIIWEFAEIEIEALPFKYVDQPLAGYVITAVDSMRVRRQIWEKCKGNAEVEMYIDPRMAAEYALSFVMNPNDEKDQESYENTLYTDQAAVEERCTAKATMYTATMIAGYVAKHVKDLITGKPYARVTHWNIEANVLQNWGKKA